MLLSLQRSLAWLSRGWVLKIGGALQDTLPLLPPSWESAMSSAEDWRGCSVIRRRGESREQSVIDLSPALRRHQSQMLKLWPG